jgi:hypothetical protein
MSVTSSRDGRAWHRRSMKSSRYSIQAYDQRTALDTEFRARTYRSIGNIWYATRLTAALAVARNGVVPLSS